MVYTLDGAQPTPFVASAGGKDTIVSWSPGTGVRAAGTLLQGERLSAKWALDTGTFVCSTKAQAEQQLKLSENLSLEKRPAFDPTPSRAPISLPQPAVVVAASVRSAVVGPPADAVGVAQTGAGGGAAPGHKPHSTATQPGPGQDQPVAMNSVRVPRPRPSFPLRYELAIVLAMFVLVNIVSAFSQAQIGVNDGKGWDGAWYVTVAQEISGGQPLVAEAPFVYRVGTPALAALVDRDNLILGFKVVNLAANVTLTLLLMVWLRLFVKDWRVRLGLILAFLLQWHGPIRFVHFYPVAADNWFAALLLAGLLAIHSLEKRVSWLAIAAVSVLALLGHAGS